jgi:NTP pyrophosphatase (non-canonical NTP hydrolase)
MPDQPKQPPTPPETAFTLDDYQQATRFWYNQSLATQMARINAMMGITGEAGELADAHKKMLFHGHPLNLEIVKLELGDILFYVSWYAWTFGLSLDDVARANLTKLTIRYPHGFDPERSQNRKDRHP